MVRITSKQKLEKRLHDKPKDWAQVIAARAALRVLPIALNDATILKNPNFTLAIIRANAISWAARNFPAHDMAAAFAAAASRSAAAAAFAAVADAAFAAVADAAVADAAFAAVAAAAVAAAFADADIWQSIEADIDWLEKYNSDAVNPSQSLTAEPLWLAGEIPTEIKTIWSDAKENLIAIDNGYSHWINWYDRRLRGHDAAFDIAHDKDRTEDKAILAKLAEATDKGFWDKGPEYVNAQLAGWLSDARARAQGRYEQEISEQSLTDQIPEIPPQNTNAITFKRGENGKIKIDPNASLDEILTDENSAERHQLALEEALEIKQKCAGNNAAARFTQLLDNYIENIGESLNTIKPSMAVQRGEKLRQEIITYDNPDHMLAPISDEILLDLKGWQSAHNMMVALQPKLNAMDTAQLGPDVKPAVFTSNDLKTLSNGANEAELLEDGTFEVLGEAVDLAPVEFDDGNRRSRWTSGTAGNLIKETAAMAINNPSRLITFAAIGKSTWSDPIKAAELLVKHRHWIYERYSDYPTMQSILQRVCDRVEEETPFKPDPKDE